MLDKLVKIANRLDQLGETKLADEVDAIVRKLASEPVSKFKNMDVSKHTVKPGETLESITKMKRGEHLDITVQDNIDLNRNGYKPLGIAPNPSFDPNKLQVGQMVLAWQTFAAEGDEIDMNELLKP